ncbi:hypothetical protein HYQ46_003592 [Verticillium longisporum]|nr:hypothetical protein HYQ46_003592 [Verticillium longisporum]
MGSSEACHYLQTRFGARDAQSSKHRPTAPDAVPLSTLHITPHSLNTARPCDSIDSPAKKLQPLLSSAHLYSPHPLSVLIQPNEDGHDRTIPDAVKLPLKDPVLALRTSRSGSLFAVITATSMAVWQTKPTAILAVVVRSVSSLSTYGENFDLLMRPDSAILVVHTTQGYLITYSLATDSEAHCT